jgi:hypothetical protein
MSFLDSLPFERLLWLVPVFFLLHNLEEAPFMESWSRTLPIKIHPAVSTRQFTIAVTFLTLAGFLLTYLGIRFLSHPIGYVLILGLQAILLFNAFFPHIAASIRFRRYSPGVVTAVLITLPFSYYLFRRALDEPIINWNELWILFAVAPFAMVIFASLSLQIGKALDRPPC